MFEDEDEGLETGIVFASTYARYSSKCIARLTCLYAYTGGHSVCKDIWICFRGFKSWYAGLMLLQAAINV